VNLLPEVLIGGIANAGLYALLGLSVVIIFRATRVLNFASGQYMLLGSYVVYWLLVQEHLGYVLSFALSFILMAAIGALTYIGVIRPVKGRPLFVPVILTFGISLILTSLMDIIWGSQNDTLPSPIALETYHITATAYVTTPEIISVCVAIAAMLLFVGFDRYTKVGIQVRAASEDVLLASQTGIRVDLLFMFAWALASIVALLAGLSYAYQYTVTPTSTDLGILVLAPVVIASFDSLSGVVVGSVVVGLLSNAVSTYINGNAGEAVVYGAILAVLIIRPRGFFGTQAARRL
jgi:branched-chain amino acid transport system permease protein